jgi:hypothetical protein
MTELPAAADRLAAALSGGDEEKTVAEFKQLRRAGEAEKPTKVSDVLVRQHTTLH